MKRLVAIALTLVLCQSLCSSAAAEEAEAPAEEAPAAEEAAE